MDRRNLSWPLRLVVALILAGCASQPIVEAPTLYTRLGGLEGITIVTDNLLYEVGENDHIIEFFAKTDIDRFRTKFIEHICQISDGPCLYTGDSMPKVHAQMTLERSHFDSLVDSLVAAMTASGVPADAQNELLSRLVLLYDEVMHPLDFLPPAEQP